MKTNKNEFIHFWLALLLVDFFIVIWFAYDHALPISDTAWHLLHGLKCQDLLAHAHLKNAAWWQALLAVNPLYPPFVYLVYGTFHLLLGSAYWVDLLIRILFSNILFGSIYYLSKLIFNNAHTALLSALIIFVYPAVFLFTHYDMLDLPGLAMVALALLSLTWWQQKLSTYSTVALSLSFALTALTKNNSVAFIIAPLLVSAISFLLKKDWPRIKSLALAALIGLLVILPWLIFASPLMIKAIANIQQQSNVGSANIFNFKDNMVCYISSLPPLFSPFLLTIALVAFCSAPKNMHERLFYLLLSSIGGILLLGLFHWLPQPRYMLPVVIPSTLYTAWAAVNYWRLPLLRPLLVSLAIITGFVFTETNFSPYPLPRFSLPENIKNFLGLPTVREPGHYASAGLSFYPTMATDWGQEWVLQTIEPRINARGQTLAIMSGADESDSATYAYLVKRHNINLCAFTPRISTMQGINMPPLRPDFAKLVTWYLLDKRQRDSQNSSFSNKASQNNYDHWCNFIRKSGQFKLIGIKALPNNNELELYQNLSY